MKIYCIERGIRVFLFFVVLSLLLSGTANAHKVMIFAWVEGDTIHTESKFSGGKKVKGGRITVSDKQGNLLLEGKTNDRGEFSFKVPKKTTMIISLNAGMGHRADWTVPEEEIEEVTTEQSQPSAPKETDETEQKKVIQPTTVSGITIEDIQLTVEKLLDRRINTTEKNIDKKLKTIIKMLTESRDKGPSVNDILGGIGYILGLVGLGAYIKYRKK